MFALVAAGVHWTPACKWVQVTTWTKNKGHPFGCPLLLETYDNYATDSNEFHHGFIYFEALRRKVKPSHRNETRQAFSLFSCGI